MAALDLPDPQGWVEVCQRADLPVPPPLQMERATQLLDAYGQDQPVAHLYAIHRRLALSHAAIAKRLDIMRQLSAADPSPVWDRDIRLFEQARFKELRVAFATAMRDRDLAEIETLSAEILQAAWLEPVPGDLASASKDVDDRSRQVKAVADVTDIVEKLRTAFAAKSFTDCAALLNQFKEMAGIWNGAGLTEQMAAEVRAAKAWVLQEQQAQEQRDVFLKACVELKRAVDAEASERDLHMAYHTVTELGDPIPDGLQSKYDALLAARARGARARMFGWIGAVAAVLAVALGVIYWRMQVGVAHEWSHRIEQAVHDRNLTLANQLIEEQERRAPGATANTEVVVAKGAVGVLREETERDQDSFRHVLASAAKAADTTTLAMGNATTPDQWWSAVADAEETLGRAGKLHDLRQLDPDDRLGSFVRHLTADRDVLRRRYSAWVMTQVEDASRKADVSSLLPRIQSITAVEADLETAERSLETARQALDRCSDDVKAAAALATPKVAHGREAVRLARAEYDARMTLAGSTRSVASARRALQQFATQFPSSSLTPEFTRAAAAADVYESVERWNAIAAGWAKTPAPANDKTALQRLEIIQGFVRDNPLCPLVPAITLYGEYLRQAASALASPNGWQQPMAEILSAPLWVDLSVLEATDKTRYYVLADPAVRKQGLGDRARTVFDAIDPQNINRKKTVSLPPQKSLVSEKPALVPHAVFLRDLAEQMKTVDDRNWDTWGIDLVDRLAADEKMDAVVRAILLREAISAVTAIDGWALGNFYDRSLGELTRQRLDPVVWYDQEHPVPAITLTNLKAIVSKIPRGAGARSIVQARRGEVFQVLKPNIVGLGMLLKDDDDKWQVVVPPGTSAGQIAEAILVPPEALRPPDTAPAGLAPVPASQPTSAPTIAPALLPSVPSAPPPALARWIKVASRGNKALVVDDAAVRNLPQGTLVFLVQP